MSYTQFNPNSKGLEELNMTSDEVNRFSDALKKKEFVDMLGDYMKEISDPNNRSEYDEYLKQLERDNELPQGTELLNAREGFCIKTQMISNKDKKNIQKLFINICQHERVQKPESKEDKQGQKKGQQWSLPYVAGKVRLDQTNKKEICQTLEVCFHDQVIEYCIKSQGFQKIVCDTAIEAAQKQSKERDETVSKDYKIMDKLKCKGGKPATLTVRSQFLENPQEAYKWENEMGKRQKSETAGPKLFQEFTKAQQQRDQEKKKEQEQSQKVETQAQEQQEKPKKVLKKINAPQYKIQYSYETAYEDFLDSSKSQRKLPKQIMVCIDLPSSVNQYYYKEGIQNLKLDIDQKLLIFQIPNKHYLEVKLPYFVDQEAGDAKYDKKNRTLKIRLPLTKDNVYNDPTLESISKADEQNDEQEEQQDQQEVQQGQQNDEQVKQVQQNQNNQQQHQQQGSLLEVSEKKNILNIIDEKQVQQQEYKETFIQEIDQTQQVEQKQEEQKQEEQQDTKISQMEFKYQQMEDFIFFMFNIKGYEKNQVKACISNQQVRILYENKNQIQYQSVKINKQIDQQLSKIDLVTDYIIVKLKKQEEEMWENNQHEILNEDYELFQKEFFSQQEQIELMEKQKQQQIEEENLLRIQKEKELQEEQDYIKEIEKKEKESKQEIEGGKQKDPKMNQINQIANSLQFLEFQSEFIFSLD